MAKNNNTVSDSDTKTTAAETAAAVEATVTGEPEATVAVENEKPTDSKPRYDGITIFAYCGPSLPGGRLKSNTILCGTYAEITEYYKEAIALYPNAAKLIVPVTRLAETREKTKTSGNLMYQYFTEIAAAMKAEGENK